MPLVMYTSFFGLNEKPFAITPDPRYLYLSERHTEALAHLAYGISEAGGFIQLTGEVGTGKTTVLRSLLQQLPPHCDVALILNPRVTPAEFLLAICDELHVQVPDAFGRQRQGARRPPDAFPARRAQPRPAHRADGGRGAEPRSPTCSSRCACSRTSRPRRRSSCRSS